MHQRPCALKGTNDPCRTTRISLAKDWNRPLPFKNATYLLVLDYFFRYPEIQKLSTTTSHSIIEALKAMFARFGIPETVSVTMVPSILHMNFQSSQRSVTSIM